jgi:hypothetical protein
MPPSRRARRGIRHRPQCTLISDGLADSPERQRGEVAQRGSRARPRGGGRRRSCCGHVGRNFGQIGSFSLMDSHRRGVGAPHQRRPGSSGRRRHSPGITGASRRCPEQGAVDLGARVGKLDVDVRAGPPRGPAVVDPLLTVELPDDAGPHKDGGTVRDAAGVRLVVTVVLGPRLVRIFWIFFRSKVFGTSCPLQA